MTTPIESLQADLKSAMRNRDKARTATLRMLLTAAKNDQIASGAPLDDDGFLAVVKRGIKQRKDAAAQYREGGRDELAEQEEQEAALLADYLPVQASEEDLQAAIEAFVEQEGLSGPKAMGQVMKAMLAQFGAAADGGTISRLARDVLNR